MPVLCLSQGRVRNRVSTCQDWTQRQPFANAGFRGRVITTRENLWRGGPFKPLSHGMAKTGGRNNSGTVTAWHRGGGARKIYRMIDFTRDPAEKGAGIVERVEYDPNRTARIALVKHPDGGFPNVLQCTLTNLTDKLFQ